MLDWLFYNSFLPLLPVPLVCLGLWIIGIRRKFFSIIRDGQLCFYCTTTCAIALRDLIKAGKAQVSVEFPVAFIVTLMILTTFVYGIAVTAKDAKDWKLAIISGCATVITTVFVVAVRLKFDLL